MKITTQLYTDELTTPELEDLFATVHRECVTRGTKMPEFDVRIMATAEFKTHLAKVVDEATKRCIPVHGGGTGYVSPLVHTEEALVESGRHIHAIKEYRARTGVGLKDAKDCCDAYRSAWEAIGKPVGGVPRPGNL